MNHHSNSQSVNMKILFRCKYFLMCAVLFWGKVEGETISWYSPVPQANLTSTNQQLDGAFGFELGVFTNGFIPTAGNIAEWSRNWVSAQSTAYNPTTQVFDGLLTVKTNAAPFTKGAKAYIWYRRSNTTQDEWMLFRKSDWTWPGKDSLSPFPLIWNTAHADEVIIGEVLQAGNPFLMKTGAVVSYDQWQNTYLASSSLNGPNDDSDHDGTPNLLEFVFGSSPTQASVIPEMRTELVMIDGNSYLQISVPRLQNQLVTTQVEVSSDMINWSSGDSSLVNVSDTPEMLIVRDKTVFGAGQGRRFMRLSAAVEP